MVNLKELLADYKNSQNNELEKHLNFFKALDFNQAFKHAILARGKDGKLFPHQRLIANKLKGCLRDMEMGKSNIEKYKNFEDILNKVAASISGKKPLYKYDVALRLGANLGVMPKYVYLHAGTITGAKNLGLPHTKTYLEEEDFNTPSLKSIWKALKPYEIEDFLCIYKDSFSGGNVGRCNTKVKKHCSR